MLFTPCYLAPALIYRLLAFALVFIVVPAGEAEVLAVVNRRSHRPCHL